MDRAEMGNRRPSSRRPPSKPGMANGILHPAELERDNLFTLAQGTKCISLRMLYRYISKAILFSETRSPRSKVGYSGDGGDKNFLKSAWLSWKWSVWE